MAPAAEVIWLRTKDDGLPPVGKVTAVAKVPSPFPSSTAAELDPPLAVAMSRDG